MGDASIWKDVHIRITDQRIGAGIGGWDTVLKLYHVPTGITVEVPRGRSSQHKDRQIAMEMMEYAVASENWGPRAALAEGDTPGDKEGE
jgi:protein subunit release factor A